jgi:hypothetical protein
VEVITSFEVPSLSTEGRQPKRRLLTIASKMKRLSAGATVTAADDDTVFNSSDSDGETEQRTQVDDNPDIEEASQHGLAQEIIESEIDDD